MIGEMHQGVDGNRDLYENCKDMAILLRIFFEILESIRTSGHGLETTNEL